MIVLKLTWYYFVSSSLLVNVLTCYFPHLYKCSPFLILLWKAHFIFFFIRSVGGLPKPFYFHSGAVNTIITINFPRFVVLVSVITFFSYLVVESNRPFFHQLRIGYLCYVMEYPEVFADKLLVKGQLVPVCYELPGWPDFEKISQPCVFVLVMGGNILYTTEANACFIQLLFIAHFSDPFQTIHRSIKQTHFSVIIFTFKKANHHPWPGLTLTQW